MLVDSKFNQTCIYKLLKTVQTAGHIQRVEHHSQTELSPARAIVYTCCP